MIKISNESTKAMASVISPSTSGGNVTQKNILENDYCNIIFNSSKEKVNIFKFENESAISMDLFNGKKQGTFYYDDSIKSITYYGIRDGVDLKYELISNKLVMSIILNKKYTDDLIFKLDIGDMDYEKANSNQFLKIKKNSKREYGFYKPYLDYNNQRVKNCCSFDIGEKDAHNFLSLNLNYGSIYDDKYEFPIIIKTEIEYSTKDLVRIINLVNGIEKDISEEASVGYSNKIIDNKQIEEFYAINLFFEKEYLNKLTNNERIYLKLPFKTNTFQFTDLEQIVIKNKENILCSIPSSDFAKKNFAIDITDLYSNIMSKDNDDEGIDLLIASSRDKYLIYGTEGYYIPSEIGLTSSIGVYKLDFIHDINSDEKITLIHHKKKKENIYNEYELYDAGKLSINVQNGYIYHTYNALCNKIPVNLIKNWQNKEHYGFLGGWRSNYNILLTKRYDSTNKKNIYTLLDEFAKGHVYEEKWYYLDDKNNRIYIGKEDIQLDANSDLIYSGDGESRKVYIEGETSEDFTVVTLNKRFDFKNTNYKKRYFLQYKNFKKELFKGQENHLHYYYYKQVDGEFVKYYPLFNAIYIDGNNYYYDDENGEKKLLIQSEMNTSIELTDIIYYGYGRKSPITNLFFEAYSIKIEDIAVEEPDILKKPFVVDSDSSELIETIDQIENEINRINKEIEYRENQLKEYINYLDNEKDTYFSNSDNNEIEGLETIINNYSKTCNSIEKELLELKKTKSLYESNLISYNELFNKYSDKLTQDGLYVVNYSDGEKRFFDSHGRMTKIINNQGEIKIYYVGYKDYISHIITDEYKVEYKYKEDQIISIVDTNGDEVSFDYQNNNYIITRNNERKTRFLHNIDYYEIESFDGSIVKIYSNEDTLDVDVFYNDSDISDYSNRESNDSKKHVVNQRYTFNELPNQTTITNNDTKLNKCFFFDKDGNLIKLTDNIETSYYSYEGNYLISSGKMKNNNKQIISIGDFNFNSSNEIIANKAMSIISSTSWYGLIIELDTGNVNNIDITKLVINCTLSGSKGEKKYKKIVYERMNESVFLPLFYYGKVNNIVISISSDDQTISASSYINDINLYKFEECEYYEYDSKGRISKMIKENTILDNIQYNDNDAVKSYSKTGFSGKTITINNKYSLDGNLITSETSEGDVYEYVYHDDKYEEKYFNRKDPSLIKLTNIEYDKQTNEIIDQGTIKDNNGNYPISKVELNKNNGTIKNIVSYDGSKMHYNYNEKQLLSIISELNGKKNSIAYKYNYGYLTRVNNNGIDVSYSYDCQGRIKRVNVNAMNKCLLLNEYEDKVSIFNAYGEEFKFGNKVTSIYNESVTITSEKDYSGKLINLSKIDSNNKYYSSFIYNSDDYLESYEISKEGEDSYIETVDYKYDDFGNVSSYCKKRKRGNDSQEVIKRECEYNEYGIVSDIIYSDNEIIQKTINEYNDGILSRSIINNIYVEYQYDAMKRLTHVSNDCNNISICHTYDYLQQDENSLDLISEDNTILKTSEGYFIEKKSYKYDVNGRIIEVQNDNDKIQYEYDSVGRLIKEKNGLLKKEFRYVYDATGNIINKAVYSINENGNLDTLDSINYIYSCKNRDVLLSFGNQQFEYDDIGRPISIGDTQLEWNDDDTLKTYMDENNFIEFLYDENNIRYRKTINGIQTDFFYDGNRLIKEIRNGKAIKYCYQNNKPISFEYQGKKYLYETNIFGDIIRMYSEEGVIVAEYQYDAYGNTYILRNVDGIAEINPLRYRGYYYDSETSLYYITSRYYDPEIGRFISPDSVDYLDPATINGLNLYAYCGNDPVNRVDPTGHFAISSFLIGLGISALIGAVVGAFSYTASEGLSYAITGEFTWSWAQFAGSVIGGAIGGAISMIPGMGTMAVAGITGALSTGIGMHLQNQWEGTNYSVGQILFTSTINGLVSASAAGIFEAIPIKGLNRGRGSYEAIAKQINTKFFNGTIKHISYNTFSKVLTYNMIGSLIGTGYSGIMDVCNGNDWLSNLIYQRIGRNL